MLVLFPMMCYRRDLNIPEGEAVVYSQYEVHIEFLNCISILIIKMPYNYQ